VTLDATTFERTMQMHRGFGRVFCDWRPRTHVGEPAADELDEYVAMVFGDVHDDQWSRGGYRQVSAQYARQLVAFWLANNLADEAPPPLPKEVPAGADVAASATKPFFDLFTEDPTFFTNVSQAFPAHGASTAFMTKTIHDRDAGVIVADRNQIGLFWFADDE
jgi:hypothetical protein